MFSHDKFGTAKKIGLFVARACIRGATVVFIVLISACGVVQSEQQKTVVDHADKTATLASINRWSFSDLEEPSDTASASGSLTLGETARYGALDADGWMADVNAVAVNESVVVAMSWQACEVVVFSRRTQHESVRFGRCGEGPGEFRNPGAVAIRGDTIVISDHRGRRLQHLSMKGVLYAQVLLDTLVMQGTNHIQTLHWWRDSVLVTSNYMQSHQLRAGVIFPRHASHPFVRAFSVQQPERQHFSAVVEGPMVSRSTYGEQREIAACVVPGRSSSDARLVAVNQWSSQLVVAQLDSFVAGSRAVQMNRSLSEFPLSVMQSTIRPGSMIALAFHGACGDSVALFSYREYTDTSSNFAQSARFLAVTPQNNRHFVGRATREQDAQLGKLIAAHGNAFFFAHNSRFGYPLIVEMQLRLTQTERHASQP